MQANQAVRPVLERLASYAGPYPAVYVSPYPAVHTPLYPAVYTSSYLSTTPSVYSPTYNPLATPRYANAPPNAYTVPSTAPQVAPHTSPLPASGAMPAASSTQNSTLLASGPGGLVSSASPQPLTRTRTRYACAACRRTFFHKSSVKRQYHPAQEARGV